MKVRLSLTSLIKKKAFNFLSQHSQFDNIKRVLSYVLNIISHNIKYKNLLYPYDNHGKMIETFQCEVGFINNQKQLMKTFSAFYIVSLFEDASILLSFLPQVGNIFSYKLIN